MTFEVKYRNKQGATEFLRVDAASRSEVFAILKERGIPSAIQVTDVTGKKPRRGTNAGAPMSGSFKGLLALVAVCVIGAVAYLIISQDAPKPTKPAEKKVEKKSIEVATPEIAPVVEAPKVVEAPPKPKKYWEEDVMPANLTPMQQRKWKHMHRPPPGYTNDTSRTEAPPAYAIFSHHSENTIAGYLTMTPGETLVGTPHYGPGFTKDFVESMKTPIIITAEDTPEQAELKQLMIDTKIDLADRMRNGEDIGKILEETHEEYQRLASLKMEVANELAKLRKDPNATLEDVEDFTAAANKLLEERGISPITLSPIAKRMLLRRKGVQY